MLSARLVPQVTLKSDDGNIAVGFDGHSVTLGKISATAAHRAQRLRTGLPLSSFEQNRNAVDRELHLLVRQLARHGLLEYLLGRSQIREDEIVIEPQVPDYWPRLPDLDDTDILVLSRFAYMRRRGNDMVLESPRAGALFKICNQIIAAAIAKLSTPQQVRSLRRQDGFPGLDLLALLTDGRILFKVDNACDQGLRPSEGDDDLVLWDFHDLLFHARSTQGRHANPLGGLCPYAGVIPPLPAVRPRWPGKAIDLQPYLAASSDAGSRAAMLLSRRHSTRIFDDQRPITLTELSQFLGSTARVQSTWRSKLDLNDDGPELEFAARPYPSGGASYELELYLAVNKCEGLALGFYHYDAGGHAFVSIDVRKEDLEALLMGAGFAMGAPAAPQILISIAARFGRVSWKYSSIAYSLVLKNVGVLMQTLYLLTADMGLGGCAIGTADIDLFARMTGMEFHVEGPVGQFAIGRRPS
jgi:SagB-type dehydrogenase family enzyme